MTQPELIKKHKTAGGWTTYWQHRSDATGTIMRFSVYLPPQSTTKECPSVWFLSGLTCNEETFMIKAGAQKSAAKHGLILVVPDTSPRGTGLPGEQDSWDFGIGAGFWLNAIEAPWSRHWRMYDWVTDELKRVVEAHFPAIPDCKSIMGHSMGGHGALVLGLRQPREWRSISAFAPICAPTECPWGEKAFAGYLGQDRASWLEWDATHLVQKAKDRSQRILVDQGTTDEFLELQLKPDRLQQACRAVSHPLQLRMHEGYDHGYYFIQSFIEDHLDFHAKALQPHALQ